MTYEGPDLPVFEWDYWKREALARGVPEEVAELGCTVMREAYLEHWPPDVQLECGWEDDGLSMLAMAQKEPERAKIRWRYLRKAYGKRARTAMLTGEQGLQ